MQTLTAANYSNTLSCRYDAKGSMLSDGTWTYTWEHGRELATMSNGSTTWTNTYNADGLRTKRTNGSTTYNYIYNGSSLSQMIVGSNTLYFAYDASGTPMSVTYNGTNYYYATNVQGDVTAILNASGTAVVQYTYDAWGKILTTTGDMASTLGAHNPLRYRGYVYDTETTLYYLQSRYYNPAMGRFISADNYPSTGQGLTGNNMFAYCGNNPVDRCDSQGTLWEIVIAGVIASVVSGISNAISTAINGGSVEECVVAGLIGAGSAAVGFGVAIATGFSPAGNLAARAVASTICDLGTTYYLNGKITANDLLATAVDVTLDVGFSHYIYSYTDPINDFVKQTFVNSMYDGGFDVFEVYAQKFDENARNAATQATHFSGGSTVREGGIRRSHVMVAM